MSDAWIRLDLNNPVFQRSWFGLPKREQWAVLGTLRKLSDMTWDQAYRDPGLKWELIHTRTGPNGERLYSFRMGKGFRAVAYRDGYWLRVLSLHPDHDSAYR
ncbi:hypothetical protein [Kyrpidia spormannii]|uniref:Cytotoxic translational repressor of toxin-antitoxin stability system n=1 Tax=Kyrpidia spormannii TaxID=2055160 RepID=A0A6F9EH35_9BACL|nr:hypothetical protein [Kyrpidia spormannii]CAB3396171.1 conserved protein of unknown function [Kyrpidia spormannii]